MNMGCTKVFRFICTLMMAILTMASFSGCATSNLVNKANAPTYSYTDHDEEISHFLISQDEKTLVILGKDYHYIISVPANLVAILKSPARRALTATFEKITVNDWDNKLYGRLVLTANQQSASAEDKAALTELGFPASAPSEKTIQIKGVRYSSNGFKIPDGLSAFNQPYKVTITEVHSRSNKALLLFTPVTVAADGVVVLGVVVLSPFLMIAMAVSKPHMFP